MVPTTPTVEITIKEGENVSDFFDEMDEELREELKGDAPITETFIKVNNK